MIDKEEYNDDPVWYCRSCLSLKIKNFGDDEMVPCYCAACSSTDVGTATIDEWDVMHEVRYGKKFISKNKRK